jgi:hypothetical protein
VRLTGTDFPEGFGLQVARGMRVSEEAVPWCDFIEKDIGPSTVQ